MIDLDLLAEFALLRSLALYRATTITGSILVGPKPARVLAADLAVEHSTNCKWHSREPR